MMSKMIYSKLIRVLWNTVQSTVTTTTVLILWHRMIYCISELNVNECAQNGGPCENNGVCLDLVVGYNCSCKPGYTGINCETGKLLLSTH